MIKLAHQSFVLLLSVCLLAIFGTTVTSQAATPQIRAGGNHTAALRADGSLWAWGENTFGQLGDGTAISRNAPVRVGSDSDWTRLVAGYYHAVALKSDGTLWTWGDNTKGQLGDGGVAASRNAPVRVGTATDWAAVAAGDFHTLALKTDGSLWAWGDSTSGQVGNGSVVPGNQTVPVRIGTATDWAAIAAGGSHSIALKTDHTLWAWGSNAAGQLGNGTIIASVAPVQQLLPAPFVNSDWSSVSAGRALSVALKQDGTFWSWGSNIAVLPLNLNLDINVPSKETGGANSWVAVAAGDSHILGLGGDASLWSRGRNGSGQLGHGNNFDANVLGKIGADTDWSGATAGGSHTLAYKSNGSVWSWGDNSSGQLGDGTNNSKNAPVQISFNLIAAVTVTLTPDKASPQAPGTAVLFTASAGAGYDYRFWFYNGTIWSLVQNYGNGNTWTLPAATPVGNYVVAVDARSTPAVDRETVTYTSFEIAGGPASGVTLTPALPSPHTAGSAVAFTAAGQGSSGYDYRFSLFNGVNWSLVQNYGNGAVWTMPAGTPPGSYVVAADVRTSSAVDRDAVVYLSYEVTAGPATSVDVAPDQPSPHPAGTAVLFTATGQGSAGYDYRFWLFDGANWSLVQDYGNGNTWTLPAATPAGDYVIAVDVRTSSAVYRDAVTYFSYQVI